MDQNIKDYYNPEQILESVKINIKKYNTNDLLMKLSILHQLNLTRNEIIGFAYNILEFTLKIINEYKLFNDTDSFIKKDDLIDFVDSIINLQMKQTFTESFERIDKNMMAYDRYLDYSNNVRGDAFPEQILDKTWQVYNKFGDKFEKIFKFTIENLFSFIHALRIFYLEKFRTYYEKQNEDEEIVFACFAIAQNDNGRINKEKLYEIALQFDKEISPKKIDDLISFFTTDFTKSIDIGYDILYNPIISNNAELFVLHWNYFAWYLFEKLELHIKKNDQKGYIKLCKLKGEWLEYKTHELLSNIFPLKNIILNPYYYIKSELFEGDIFVRFHNTFLIFECKSSSIRRKSKEGNFNAFIDDIKVNLGEAYSQAKRFEEYLRRVSQGDLNFYNKTGKQIVYTIEKTNIDRILLVSVTNDNLKMITTMLKAYKEENIYRKEDDFISFNIHDLDIVLDHLKSPTIFIDYLSKRLKMDKRLHVSDEIDYLGYYKENLLNMDFDMDESMKEAGLIYLSDNYIPEVEKNFYKFKEIEPPKINIDLLNLIKSIEICDNNIEDLFKVLERLLNAPIEEQDKIISELKNSVSIVQKKETLRSFMFVLSFDIKKIAIAFMHFHHSKLSTEINEHVKLNLEKIKHEKVQDMLIFEMKDELVVSNIEVIKNISNRKIGRNEKCPCGSGKKYKYCCINKH